MSNRNFLRLIVITSLVAVVSLSCFSIFFLSPSFTGLIIKNAELEAVKVARYLAEPLRDRGVVSRELPRDFVEMTRRAVADFGLMKIKVFAPDGETVFSSVEQDIGEINARDYFHHTVARGRVFTKVINKNAKSLEGQVVRADVVETYVPIMHNGRFAGAFEIYLDITDNKKELTGLLTYSHSLMLLLAAGLMLAVLAISLVARRSFIRQEQAEKKTMQQSLDLQEKNSELSVLNDVSHALGRSLDLQTLLPLILETVVNRLPVLNLAKKGGIMLVEGEKMELVAHLGHDESFLQLHADISIHDCLCGLAARSGKVIVSRNSHQDSRHTFCYDNMQPHGHIIVPLKSASKTVGVLYLYLPADIELGEFKIDLLESMATQVGMAIDNARLYAETRNMALHDPLTGLANRRYMDANLKQAISMAERYGKPLCVALLDIDYFKQYNDTHGHHAGDRLLTMVADKIIGAIRETDMAARYGGEEFLLILPESDLGGACRAVDRIRQDIEDSLPVTISGGVAVYSKGSSDEELIKTVDGALYRAKENGRNRVECG